KFRVIARERPEPDNNGDAGTTPRARRLACGLEGNDAQVVESDSGGDLVGAGPGTAGAGVERAAGAGHVGIPRTARPVGPGDGAVQRDSLVEHSPPRRAAPAFVVDVTATRACHRRGRYRVPARRRAAAGAVAAAANGPR